jgi:hypothetical protein
MWCALSGERIGLSFTIAAGPRQRSHSRVGVPRDSWSYFTVSDWRHPQPGGLSPRNCIPQEQGGPVIPPVTGLPSRRLLRLIICVFQQQKELLRMQTDTDLPHYALVCALLANNSKEP